jgi:hypothetical protein
MQKFTAFYPSRPYWAVSKASFEDRSQEYWLREQMAEEVFSQSTDKYTLKVCRDGRILLRIEALEQDLNLNDSGLENTVKIWGEYLDFLNAFYLLLDSSTIEIAHMSYFSLHEITNRDAFRDHYKEGKSGGENVAAESVASVFQMERFLSGYIPGIPIEHQPRITMRQIIPLDVIEHASNSFKKVVYTPGLEKTLASFAKSLSEYKVGNYETSIVLSWFIIEAEISQLWLNHLESLNRDLPDGRKRINRDRRKYLTGRDFPISLVSNLLELWDVLPQPLFQDIDDVRRFRNDIVHGEDFEPSASETQLALKTSQTMIERQSGLHFVPNMSYSVTGL